MHRWIKRLAPYFQIAAAIVGILFTLWRWFGA